MRVLLTGATGFLGGHIAHALVQAGHRVGACSRRGTDAASPGVEIIPTDFAQGLTAEYWLLRLVGVDVVINTVGILKPSGADTFEILHERAPMALFEACRITGVRRVIQISALGADEQAASAYHLSKRAADRYLLGLGLDAVVLQPSLIYGQGGASAAMFETLATLPLTPLPDDAGAQVQPVHVDDVVAAVRGLVEGAEASNRIIAVVGPQALSLEDFLRSLRAQLGVPGRLRALRIPDALMRAAAGIGALLPGAVPDADALGMLKRGNTGDAAPLGRLLGRAPRPLQAFVPADFAGALAMQARWRWLRVALCLALACLWIVTGIVSLGLFPVAQSYDLLARAGTPQWALPLALYGAALLDIALGVATLWRPSRPLWVAQAALIAFYTVVISVKLPEFWLHPYGPILKNVPILALLLLLYHLEKPWNTR